MKKDFAPCDLCGQPVQTPGFNLHTLNGIKKFCCEGCLRVFQLLEPDYQPVPSSSEKTL